MRFIIDKMAFGLNTANTINSKKKIMGDLNGKSYYQ